MRPNNPEKFLILVRKAQKKQKKAFYESNKQFPVLFSVYLCILCYPLSKTMKIFELKKSRIFHQSWINRFLLKTKSPNRKRSADLKSALNSELNYVPHYHIWLCEVSLLLRHTYSGAIYAHDQLGLFVVFGVVYRFERLIRVSFVIVNK